MNKFVIAAVILFAAIVGGGGAVWIGMRERAAQNLTRTADAVRATIGPSGAFSYGDTTFEITRGAAVIKDVVLFTPGFSATAETLTFDNRGVEARTVKIVTDMGSVDIGAVHIDGLDIVRSVVSGASEIRLERVASELTLGATKLRPSAPWIVMTNVGTDSAQYRLTGMSIPIKTDGFAFMLRASEIAGGMSDNGKMDLRISDMALLDGAGARVFDMGSFSFAAQSKSGGEVSFSGGGKEASLVISGVQLRELLKFLGYGQLLKGDMTVSGQFDRAHGSYEISQASLAVPDLGKVSLAVSIRAKKPGDSFLAMEPNSASVTWTDAPKLLTTINAKATSSARSPSEFRAHLWDWYSKSSPSSVRGSDVREIIRTHVLGQPNYLFPLRTPSTVSGFLDSFLQPAEVNDGLQVPLR